MAVFRVERNKGYTVMSNHHLRNKELSLKAKGLLSQMLSLPEDWDYTLKGLSLINREKIDAIREAIKELERAGYIVRSRERDEKGRLRGADYVIFEQPQPPTPDLPTLENPTLDNPTQEKPTLEKPTLENPTQLNKDIQRTDLPKKEKIITDEQSTHSIPILSPNPSPCREAATPPERKGTEATAQSAVDIYREIIKDNIDYHIPQPTPPLARLSESRLARPPISSVSISARPPRRRWRTKSSVCSVKKSAECNLFLNLMKKSLTFRLWQDRKKHTYLMRREVSPIRH